MKKVIISILYLILSVNLLHPNEQIVQNTSNRELNNSNYKKAKLLFQQFLRISQQVVEGNRLNNQDTEIKIKKIFDEIIRISPESEYGYYQRATVEMQKKKFQIAIKYFTKAIEINPMFSDAYTGRAYVNICLKNYNTVIIDCTKVIELNPRRYDAYLFRCVAYEGSMKYVLALKDLNKAIAIIPKLSLLNEIKKLKSELNELISLQGTIRPNTRIKVLSGRFKIDNYFTRAILREQNDFQRFQSSLLSLSLEILNFIDNSLVRAEGNLSSGLTYECKIRNGKILINLGNMSYITLIIKDVNTLIGEGVINGIVFKRL